MKSLSSLLFCTFFFSFFSGGNIKAVVLDKASGMLKYNVFCAGDNQVNSYRIPSIVTAKDGSLLVFCEARHDSWTDKSRTDIVVKRSTDEGKSWSDMQDLTQGHSGAYMDPTPIVDYTTGRIFLFTTFWPENDHSGATNKAIMLCSDDNGNTWSTPKDVTSSLIPKERASGGFGPGSGLQMKGDAYKGRLILPMRLIDVANHRGHDVAAYSDDHGVTWNIGTESDNGDEFQIAESPYNILIYNARVKHARMVARSTDGGVTWSASTKDSYLPGVSKGCQGSVVGVDSLLYYSGIQGITETPDLDERAQLTLYKSNDGGATWKSKLLLYDKASGYSCITLLPDGRLAIIFETADTKSFTRKSIPNTKPLKRPSGWMRLDLLIVPTINL